MLTTHAMQSALVGYFHGRGFSVHLETLQRLPFNDLEFFVDLTKLPTLRIRHLPRAARVSMPELWGERRVPGHFFVLDAQDRVLDTLVVHTADELGGAIKRFLPLEVIGGDPRRRQSDEFDPVLFL